MLSTLIKKPITLIIAVSLGIISVLWLTISIVIGHFTFTEGNSLVQLIVTIGMVINAILPFIDKWKVKQGVKNPSGEWKKLNNVINEAHDWVDQNKLLIRTQHELTLTISKYVDAIIIERNHVYCINNPYKDEPYINKKIKIVTDLGTYKDMPAEKIRLLRNIDLNENLSLSRLDLRGGFSFIKIGDDTLIKGSALLLNAEHNGNGYEIHRSPDETKVYFEQDNVIIPANGKLRYEIQSFAVYRFYDKFQWVFNDFCDNLKMKVIKKDKPKRLRYRINHHKATPFRNSDNETDTFNFANPIFPYQSFEMRWEFD